LSGAASSDRDAARGRWLVLAATVLWGTSATLARAVFRDHHVPPLQVVELRLLIAVALLGPWLLIRKRSALRVPRRDWGYFLILGLFGVATVQGSYYYSIAVLGVGLAILLQYLAPALIVAYEAARGKPAGRYTVIAIVCAVLGTALLVGGLGAGAAKVPAHGWVIGFSSAFAFAFYILYSKRGLEHYPPETVLFYTFSIAGLLWACVNPPWRIVAAGYAPGLWGMFLCLGVFSTLAPFALFVAGLKRLPAAQTGILATFEPVVAVLAAAAFLGEGLRPIQWAGALLVLVASLLASRQVPAPHPLE
jgi:drug/metabolite transporter (DMT)-like permease